MWCLFLFVGIVIHQFTLLLCIFCSRSFAANWQRELLTFGLHYHLYKHCYQVEYLVTEVFKIIFISLAESLFCIFKNILVIIDSYFINIWRTFSCQFVALRPIVSSSSDVVDDSFSQWKQPTVQQALSQVRHDVKVFFLFIFLFAYLIIYYVASCFWCIFCNDFCLDSYPTHMVVIFCRLCRHQHHHYTVHFFMPVLAIYHRFHHHTFVSWFILIISVAFYALLHLKIAFCPDCSNFIISTNF